MRFRPRRTVTYLLVGISVFVVLANVISYSNKTVLDRTHPVQDGLLGPRNPNPVFFDERFRKYDDERNSSATARIPPPPVVVVVRTLTLQTRRLFTGRAMLYEARADAALQGGSDDLVAFNGSANEEYREQFVRRVTRSDSAAEDPSSSVWVPKTDRHHEIVDDRIVKQMNFVPLRYRRQMARSSRRRVGDRPVQLKTIYVPGGLDAETPLGTLKFANDKCPVSACNITTDSIHELTADLRLLQADAYFSSSDRKPSGQIWAIWILESPANTADFVGPDNLINWTATYRWDSTLVTPYAKFVPFPSKMRSHRTADPAPPPPPTRNYAANKTKMVAWFVSNCNAKNRRWELAQELQKYIPVDIFGACGSIDCPRSAKSECNDRLSTDYKFYLSFENSNCDYYITEKFFENGLGNDVIPIVMGGRKADYLRASPPNSFIHVDDFRSVVDLAEYLLKLNASDHLYNDYFRWKGSGERIDTKFWCRLCALLHDDERPLMWYTKFHKWWMHEGACRTGRWEY